MLVLLVRHAHALARSEWRGDDRDRDLSARGRGQSAALVPILREFKPERILSSPYSRCVDTVVPLATALGIGVEPVEALAEGAGYDAVRLVRSVRDRVSVLCSHGDVIPEILAALASEDRLDVGRNPRDEKASVWVLRGPKERFTRAAYLRPPVVKAPV
jgi:broad specificity phosphatase PhoE